VSTGSGAGHDGIAAQLVEPALGGSFAPALSTAVFLAMGGVHLYRRRATPVPRATGMLPS
jgi:hypothetical protein